MKKLLMLFVAIVMMAGFTTRVTAQTISETKSNQGRAEILTSIALTTVTPLEFGGIAIGIAQSTVKVDTASARTLVTGDATLLTTNHTPTAAYYTLTGTGSTLYTITIPTSDVIITKVSGSATMVVNNFTCTYPTLTHVLTSAGIGQFHVGATLTVGATQIGGTYTGPFDVTVAY